MSWSKLDADDRCRSVVAKFGSLKPVVFSDEQKAEARRIVESCISVHSVELGDYVAIDGRCTSWIISLDWDEDGEPKFMAAPPGRGKDVHGPYRCCDEGKTWRRA